MIKEIFDYYHNGILHTFIPAKMNEPPEENEAEEITTEQSQPQIKIKSNGIADAIRNKVHTRVRASGLGEGTKSQAFETERNSGGAK